MTSIKQNSHNSIQASSAQASHARALSSNSNRNINCLPDFRNLGICLRLLIIVNLMTLITAILQATSFVDAIKQLAQVSVFTQPILLLSILLLYAASPRLRKLPYLWGVTGIIFLEIVLTSIAQQFGNYLFGAETMPGLMRTWLLVALASAIVLYYFNLRHRALTPAIAEARLQALQARIRPHFLFNCINAVISVVRSNPKRAETALEDMADLFRVLMADNRNLVPLATEIALSRQYLALEKLRLDERLNIVWQIDNMPPDALIPPLVLQPLLENAVYHGIEPIPEGGEITIKIYTSRKEVHLVMCNPYPAQSEHHNGNKMALTNIRERLALHFDAEASLTSKINENKYEVHIVIPYRPRTKI